MVGSGEIERPRMRLDRRRSQTAGESALDPWRGDDCTLLGWLHALPRDHGCDEVLLEIVASDRHLYVRQAAALAMSDSERLVKYLRHHQMLPILTRKLSRVEDLAYLADLVQTSRNPQVRQRAQSQLQELSARLLSQISNTTH